MEIPINAAYKINDFQIFAGPYIAFGLGGENKEEIKYDGESEEYKTKFKPKFGKLSEDDFEEESDEDYDYFKAFDFGLNLGVGYAFVLYQ